MQIDQVLVTASPGDAITNSSFELRSLLRRIGPSEIFARYIDPALAGDVHRLEDYDHRRRVPARSDVILYHASIGEPHVFNFISDRPERVVLMYHNISPAAGFRPYDPAFAGLLDAGRVEVAALRDRVVLALADSQFNAEELRGYGYRDVRVAGLIVDAGGLLEVAVDDEESANLAGWDGPSLLFVGQLLPHKRPDLLLKAFHLLTTYLVPDARLFLVGPSRLPIYRAALDAFVRELNLPAAVIRGTVTDAQLVAHYRRADVFVTASEHEGFCVPLLEAMAFDVPIVARAHGAIPETLADAGLLLPPADDAALLAEALAEMCTNEALRRQVVERGRRVRQRFEPERSRASILEHLAAVI